MVLINALSANHPHLQSQLNNAANGFCAQTIVYCILQEDQLLKNHSDQDSTPFTILAAQGCGKPRSLCSHCNKPGHLADFCIQPGGKMAGCSIDEARTTQCTALGKPIRLKGSPFKTTPPTNANVATTTSIVTSVPSSSSSTPAPDSVVIGGATYYLTTTPQSSNACLAQSDDSGSSS
jgi:hypothetical protein